MENQKWEEVDMGEQLEKDFAKESAEKSKRGEVKVTILKEKKTKETKGWLVIGKFEMDMLNKAFKKNKRIGSRTAICLITAYDSDWGFKNSDLDGIHFHLDSAR